MTFDTPLQTVLSLVALLAWTYAVLRSDGAVRSAYAIVWLVCVFYAFASLTYVDAIPGETARAIQFAARGILAASGLLVGWNLLRPHLGR